MAAMGMDPSHAGWGIGLLVLLYLLLLARSAWKQGELGQFLRALAIVTGLVTAIILFIRGWIWLDLG